MNNTNCINHHILRTWLAWLQVSQHFFMCRFFQALGETPTHIYSFQFWFFFLGRKYLHWTRFCYLLWVCIKYSHLTVGIFSLLFLNEFYLIQPPTTHHSLSLSHSLMLLSKPPFSFTVLPTDDYSDRQWEHSTHCLCSLQTHLAQVNWMMMSLQLMRNRPSILSGCLSSQIGRTLPSQLHTHCPACLGEVMLVVVVKAARSSHRMARQVSQNHV